jgi:hypothetical protein
MAVGFLLPDVPVDHIPPFASVRLDNLPPVAALGDSPPAVMAESNGAVRVAVMPVSAEDSRRYLLVETVLRLGAAGQPTQTLSEASLPSPAIAARVEYFVDGATHRVDWAAWTQSGEVFTNGLRGLRSVRAKVAPSDPPFLIVLRDCSYLVEGGPGGVVLQDL